MNAKQGLSELCSAIRNRDTVKCGNAPTWILEELLKRLEHLLAKGSDAIIEAEAEAFVVGAIRFVTDRCGSECDALVDTLSRIA